jgi:hypothetical protein
LEKTHLRGDRTGGATGRPESPSPIPPGTVRAELDINKVKFEFTNFMQ